MLNERKKIHYELYFSFLVGEVCNFLHKEKFQHFQYGTEIKKIVTMTKRKQYILLIIKQISNPDRQSLGKSYAGKRYGF